MQNEAHFRSIGKCPMSVYFLATLMASSCYLRWLVLFTRIRGKSDVCDSRLRHHLLVTPQVDGLRKRAGWGDALPTTPVWAEHEGVFVECLLYDRHCNDLDIARPSVGAVWGCPFEGGWGREGRGSDACTCCMAAVLGRWARTAVRRRETCPCFGCGLPSSWPALPVWVSPLGPFSVPYFILAPLELLPSASFGFYNTYHSGVSHFVGVKFML